MNQPEDEGSHIPSTALRPIQVVDTVRNFVSDITHPGNSIALAESEKSYEAEQARRASIQPEMQEIQIPQFKVVKDEAAVREACECAPIQLLEGTTLELMNKFGMGTLGHPFDEATDVIAHDGKLTVVTGHNKQAEYQLETKRILVNEGDVITIPYKITIFPGGKVSFGLLSTGRNGWYGASGECIFDLGNKMKVTRSGNYVVTVPQGETMTSLVFRNYYLGEDGHSTFTIEELKFLKRSNERS